MAPKRAPRKEIKASPPAKKAKSAASGRKPAKQGESTPVQMEMLVAEVTKRVLEGLRAPTQVVNEQQSSGDAATGVLDNAVANLSNQLIGGLSGISSPRAIQTGNALPVAAGAGQCGGVVGTQSGSVEAGATSGLGLQQATMDGFPLGSSVAASLRGKIMADEYINLGLLIVPNQTEEFTLSVSQNALQVKQLQKNRGIYNIDQWSQAFALFMSVYVEMLPDQVQQLLKYSFLIRQMAKSFPGYAWRSYDEQFRQNRSITKWPWDKVIQELYMSSVSVAFAATAHPTAPTWQQRRPPMRFPGGYGQRPNIRPFRQQARAPFNYQLPRYHPDSSAAGSDHSGQHA